MAIRIPKRQVPTRVTVADAFARLISQVMVPDADIDLPGAVYFASMRVSLHHKTNSGYTKSTLPTTPFLTADPIDVADALLQGISSGFLSVQGLPEVVAEAWKATPYIQDWSMGVVWVGPTRKRQGFRPTLDMSEIDRLFNSEDQPTESDAADEMPGAHPADLGGKVSPAALQTFVRATMAVERMTEAAMRERSRLHFGIKHFTDRQWRAAWKEEPNRLRPGERPAEKSGA